MSDPGPAASEEDADLPRGSTARQRRTAFRTGRSIGLTCASLVVIALVVGFAWNASRPRPVAPAPRVATSAAPAPAPTQIASPKPLAQASERPSAAPALMPRVDDGWVSTMSAATGIPRRAMAAYAGAELSARKSSPQCGVRWNTLAAIGFVESDHGRLGGAEILPNGDTSQPVLGPRLSGGPSIAAIRDTDGGQLDGDSVWDRAVGPMQFIPSSWKLFGVDANGDGVADPNNIDDAVFAAVRHLCASGSMSTPDGWRRAVLDYNDSPEYANAVARQANWYAARSKQAG